MTIDAHFAAYAKTTTDQTATQGFVSWVWDMRHEALSQLKANDTDQLCADVIYSIEQQAALDDEIEVPSTDDVQAWLTRYKDNLIEEITESLDD